MKPVFQRVEQHMVVSDTINLNTGQDAFLDIAKVKLSKSHIGLLNPLSVSFRLYNLEGDILNFFTTNNNTEKRSSMNYIYGGVPIDFLFRDDSYISMFEINTSKIVSYTFAGERIDSKELHDDNKVSVPMYLYLNTFLSTGKGYIFSTRGGMALFNEKTEVQFNKDAGILFSLNSATGSLNKEMTISNLIESPIGGNLTFFQLGVFKNKRYIVFNNDPTIHVFDVNSKYLTSISLTIPELEFAREISLRQQASNLGISYFNVTKSGFRFYIKKPIENSEKYETFIVDLAMDLSTYGIIQGPDNVEYVINNPRSDLAFYTASSDGVVLYMADIIE
ncbi:MAG: hypothetical protein COW40_02945 [Cytophagales bacterium CG17_big_fil_post_rev_8_21_14_2_50_40_13]|nr:MAG: hypothetical protein COW40_02945 [Cytophagales bacterium CG17_big_fil_post_rev_8_21_14_2_50_40_13]